MAVGVIFVLILIAFRSVKALLAPLIVIAATVAGAIGVMSWIGVSYYVITSALPVILIAIAVADTIHILTGYFTRSARDPLADPKSIVVATLTDLWRPLTLTTFTTMAGFIGIGVASAMPPIAYFGWFAALGVFIAWAFSLFVLPGVLVMLAPAPSSAFNEGKIGPVSAGLTKLAGISARFPALTLAIIGGCALYAGSHASKVEINRSQIENFAVGQPIRVADEILNQRFSGTSYLDIVVETPDRDGLVDARRMRKLLDLQAHAESLPFVAKTHSIANVISELHNSINPDTREDLPGTNEAVAQYLLLYESSGDPADLEDEIDYDYQRALIRLYMNARLTGDEAPAVEAMAAYLEESFNESGMTGALSGRVNVDYHWMKRLAQSHIWGMAVSAGFVLLIATFLLRSFVLGLVSIMPVFAAILAVYAVMGANGIFIEPATSMFAAISIGVGVDFAIHFVDRLQKGVDIKGLSVAEAVSDSFPTSARATFLNACALGLGFSVLMASALPPLFKFGLLIAVAAASSFVAGLLMTTAIFALRHVRIKTSQNVGQIAAMILAIVAATLIFSSNVYADDTATLDGNAIAKQIYDRDDGRSVDRHITMELINKAGRARLREARSLRLRADGVKKSIIVFTAPKALRDTAFLTHDRQASGDEDRRWLYLPSSGRPKQIPSSDRGDYFLGTDFSFEDIANELKFELSDYTFKRLTPEPSDESHHVRITATPISQKLAKELGYGQINVLIDTTNWMPQKVDYFDIERRSLKTIHILDIEEIDGIWTPGRIEVSRHDNGRSTIFTYSSIAYGADLDPTLFTPQSLRRGMR